MCLVHVNRLVELAAKGSDEDLVDLEFHDDIGKPPALSALYTIALASGGEPRMGDAGWGDRSGYLCLLRRKGSLNNGRDGGTLGDRNAFCPENADGEDASAEARFLVAWSGGYRTSGRDVVTVSGEGGFFAFAKLPGHDDECESLKSFPRRNLH
jgi:hypothetical protein